MRSSRSWKAPELAMAAGTGAQAAREQKEMRDDEGR